MRQSVHQEKILQLNHLLINMVNADFSLTTCTKTDHKVKVCSQNCVLLTNVTGGCPPQTCLSEKEKTYMPSFTSALSPMSLRVLLPLPRELESTVASRSWGSVSGHTSPGLWVCDAVCTCCQGPPPLWPLDQCCGRTRSSSSVHDHSSWSTEGRKRRRVEIRHTDNCILS